MAETFTNTQLSLFRRCPRAYWYRYVIGISRIAKAQPLRFGAAFARGLEVYYGLALGEEPVEQPNRCAAAMVAASKAHGDSGQARDIKVWATEEAKLQAMLSAYFWRYADDGIVRQAVELPFQFDLRVGGKCVMVAGKIDAIGLVTDRRLAIIETKTTSESLEPGSPYWPRLRYDSQLATYLVGARRLGYQIDLILYDVIRKPLIRPRTVPVLDENGLKLIIGADGQRALRKDGKPQRSARKNFKVLVRPEGSGEYAERLLADVAERPDFYFARHEFMPLEDDVAEFHADLSNQISIIYTMAHVCREPWYRNAGRQTCPSCEFAGICLGGIRVGPGDSPPPGHEHLANLHPELKGHDDDCTEQSE